MNDLSIRLSLDAFDPGEPRDADGKWTGSGSSGSAHVDSPEFKAFFGKSKVVDKSGKPKVLYHATPQDISEFIPGGHRVKLKSGERVYKSGPAIWLTDRADLQNAAHNIGFEDRPKSGVNVMPLYARMEHPLVLDTKAKYNAAKKRFDQDGYGFPMAMDPDVPELMKERGYDGIIFKSRAVWGGEPDPENDADEFIVFDPEQLKSVFNKGTFDPKSAIVTDAFNPDEPRDQTGEWTAGAGAGKKAEATKPAKSGVSPAVKKWFGGPEVSNLVDENGDPKRLFHGTEKDFKKFRASKTGLTGAGVYLGQSRETSEAYGHKVMEVYARGKFIDLMDWSKRVADAGDDWAKAREQAEKDGVAGIIDNKFEDAVNVWDPKNIRAAAQAEPGHVMFEVSPNPDNEALHKRWASLSIEQQTEITHTVADKMVPEVCAMVGIKGDVHDQTGGFEGFTTAGMALDVEAKDAAKLVDTASLLGYVLSQKSMMVASHEPFPGGDQTGEVTVHLPDSEFETAKSVYDRLWLLTDKDGNHLVGGHSTLNGIMSILNFSGMPNEQFAEVIDRALDGDYHIQSRTVYTAFPQGEEYGRTFAPGHTVAPGTSISQGGADRLRDEASRLVESELEKAGAHRGASDADPGEGIVRAAGIAFLDPDGHVLLLKRGQGGDHAGEWCLPGGTAEHGEEPVDTARREAIEEIGDCPGYDLRILTRLLSDEGVDFTTFMQDVDETFVPELNYEHTEYAWVPLDKMPEPLHPGVRSAFAKVMAMDDFNPSEPRDADGKWTAGGGVTGNPNFKRWSGDAPLVQFHQAKDHTFETGKPVVVESFHGTNASEDFEQFDLEKGGAMTAAESAEQGIFSTDNPTIAEAYAKNIGMGRFLGMALGGVERQMKDDPEALKGLAKVDADVKAARRKTEEAELYENREVMRIMEEKFGDVLRKDLSGEKRQEALENMARTMKSALYNLGVLKVDGEAKKKIDAAYAEYEAANEAYNKYAVQWSEAQIPQHVMPLYVRFKNPKVYDADGKTPADFPLSDKIKAAKDDGHDGVIFMHIKDPDEVATHFVAFKPEQLKSRFNKGGFSESGIISDMAVDFDPNEPRDPDGRWTKGANSAKEESDPSSPPKPGTEFMVYRVGQRGDLKNANAGNSHAIGRFLMRLDDQDAPQPVGSERSNMVTAYRVKADKDFGSYQSGSRGKPLDGDQIGRTVRDKEVSYSFPGSGYTATKVAEVPVEALRKLGHRLHGYESFDDMGGAKAAQTVQRAFEAPSEGGEGKAPPSVEWTDTRGYVHQAGLSEPEQKIEQGFYDAIHANPMHMVRMYRNRFGNVVDPDQVKKLYHRFLGHPELAKAVHEPSSYLSKLIFQTELLAKDARGDTGPTVFTAGGSGSGKSEAMERAKKTLDIPPDSLTFDSTLSHDASSIKKIQQALDLCQGPVDVVYTNSPIEKAFRFNAKRNRAVTLDILASAHVGAANSLPKIAEHFKGNPRVRVLVVNNYDGKAGFTIGDISDVPRYNRDEVVAKLRGVASDMLREGSIDEKRYRYLVGGDEEEAGQGQSGVRGQDQWQDFGADSQREGRSGRSGDEAVFCRAPGRSYSEVLGADEFDPAEPRDADGEWTASGGSSGAEAIPAPKGIIPEKFSPIDPEVDLKDGSLGVLASETEEAIHGDLGLDPDSDDDAKTLKSKVEERLTKYTADSKAVAEVNDRLKKMAGTKRKADNFVSGMVHQWAVSSGDSQPGSLAMQLTVRDLFGMNPDEIETGGMTGLKRYDEATVWKRFVMGLFDTEAPTPEDIALVKNAVRDIAKAQYQSTQEYLAEHGVKELALYRGMTYDKPEQGYPEIPKAEMVRLMLQPMSSFTYDIFVATDFAGGPNITQAGRSKRVFAVKVPASQVFSTYASGNGCMREREVVVLADPGTKAVMFHPDIMRQVVDNPRDPPKRIFESMRKEQRETALA